MATTTERHVEVATEPQTQSIGQALRQRWTDIRGDRIRLARVVIATCVWSIEPKTYRFP